MLVPVIEIKEKMQNLFSYLVAPFKDSISGMNPPPPTPHPHQDVDETEFIEHSTVFNNLTCYVAFQIFQQFNAAAQRQQNAIKFVGEMWFIDCSCILGNLRPFNYICCIMGKASIQTGSEDWPKNHNKQFSVVRQEL